MSFRKFIAPNIGAVAVLLLLWASGVESVWIGQDSEEQHIQKYMEAKQNIINNYVEELDVNQVFRNSLIAFADNLENSDLELEGSPADTTFSGEIAVGSIREAGLRFERAYNFIQEESPDEDMGSLTEHAIRGMFKDLDPHSVYIEPEESQNIQAEFEGQFEGIGIQFQMINDTITVISAISGGPSDQLGIRSGDRIISIDGESAVGWDQNRVVRTLRGEKGSEVTVEVERPGTDSILEFDIVRDEIPMYTVDSSYMIDDQTGYIKINRFAATTHDEFMEGMKELEEQGMDRIILDLRTNPGGYLEQAVRVTNEFFPRGTTLVSTDSRHARFTNEYRAQANGNYQDMPVIVLVNQGSASGSEIISGAIQDHDRGLIVGRRTFGKGLVQQQYRLNDQSNIRVTISRYMTPTGRVIQRPYKQGREQYAYDIREREDASTDVENFLRDIPDSLVYETHAGRKVYGGGGIVPDHIVQQDTISNYSFNLMQRRNIGLDFVRSYLERQDEDYAEQWKDDFPRFRTDYWWDDEDVGSFTERMQRNGMVKSDTVSTTEFRDDQLFITPAKFEEELDDNMAWLKAHMARQIWGENQYYTVFNDYLDQTLPVANTLWEDVQALRAEARDSQ